MITTSLSRTLKTGFEAALAAVPKALQTEGFGVLTEVDVQDTLKKKLGVDFRRYRILGACNPTLAHEALRARLDVGLMLPCNVTVYETEEGGSVVSAVDPTQTAVALEDPRIRKVAETVRAKLERVLQRLD
jgi:uncharacterized protein (DUF302 family)